MPTTDTVPSREERLAAARARRAGWTPDPEVVARRERDADPTLDRCSAPRCDRAADRAGRCLDHWRPMRSLVAGMAGERGPDVLTVSRRAFSEAMAATGFSLARWGDLRDYAAADDREAIDAVLDEATDALFAAGYRMLSGPRGGRYLDRKATR